jgi:predicted tellurium resistance membrane protein TerC
LEIGLGIENVSFISILVDRLPPHQRKLARSINLFAAVPMSADAEQAMIEKSGNLPIL